MGLGKDIAFIGGGRMAEALIKGILHSKLLTQSQILVADPDKARRDLLQHEYQVQTFAKPDEVLTAEIVILAVKPQVIVDVLRTMKKSIKKSHLIISIAAGIPLELMEQQLGDVKCRVIRVMPNTPALILEGASAISGGTNATPDDLEIATAIFNAVGKSVLLEERYLDAVTGLSGSGPAYVFSFIEALIDAGVKVGLARPVAETLVLQTVLGSVRLAVESNMHPAELRSMVTSPGGTTIAGLHEMERAGFAGIIMDTVEKATQRSQELGNSLSNKK